MKQPEIIKMHSGDEDHKPKNGPLKYDKGFSAKGDIPLDPDTSYPDYEEYRTPGKVAKSGMAWGLPAKIKGSPLGCGCDEAYLHAVGEISSDGQMEADYMCDAGWHNFVIFQLEMSQKASPRQLKVSTSGELTEDEDYKSGGLGDY